MNLELLAKPRLWDHLFFWIKELVLFGGLLLFIAFSFIGFFFLPLG